MPTAQEHTSIPCEQSK
uniref:Uncharacterized protein n=1 Tax=Arundo donax TaxID=35708 RepID=A0A0A9HEG4_ARUDO